MHFVVIADVKGLLLKAKPKQYPLGTGGRNNDLQNLSFSYMGSILRNSFYYNLFGEYLLLA